MPSYFDQHDCVNCNHYTSVFIIDFGGRDVPKNVRLNRERQDTATLPDASFKFPPGPVADHTNTRPLGDISLFPPEPLSKLTTAKIISGFTADSSPNKFEEAGCAVCGQLVPLRELSAL
ncbi:hypothetical protein BD779DRAFT_1453399, partial [Infundibulicybe gibba]